MNNNNKKNASSTRESGLLERIANFVKNYAKNCRDSYNSLLSL
ncbi:MAG: hypothetical protein V7724_15040 [Sediminicola sp.]